MLRRLLPVAPAAAAPAVLVPCTASGTPARAGVDSVRNQYFRGCATDAVLPDGWHVPASTGEGRGTDQRVGWGAASLDVSERVDPAANR